MRGLDFVTGRCCRCMLPGAQRGPSAQACRGHTVGMMGHNVRMRGGYMYVWEVVKCVTKKDLRRDVHIPIRPGTCTATTIILAHICLSPGFNIQHAPAPPYAEVKHELLHRHEVGVHCLQPGVFGGGGAAAAVAPTAAVDSGCCATERPSDSMCMLCVPVLTDTSTHDTVWLRLRTTHMAACQTHYIGFMCLHDSPCRHRNVTCGLYDHARSPHSPPPAPPFPPTRMPLSVTYIQRHSIVTHRASTTTSRVVSATTFGLPSLSPPIQLPNSNRRWLRGRRGWPMLASAVSTRLRVYA